MSLFWTRNTQQPGQFSFSNPDKAGFLWKEGHVVRSWRKVQPVPGRLHDLISLTAVIP